MNGNGVIASGAEQSSSRSVLDYRSMVRPALVRQKTNAWVAGVASGIARHLGWPIWLVRWVFVLLTIVNFLGVISYGVLWVLIPDEKAALKAPGLEAANRAGMRSEGKQDKKKERNWGAFSAILLVGMGVVWLVQLSGMGVSKTIFIPLLLASVGIAIVWQQADHSILTATDPSVSRWLQPFVGGGRLGAILRVIIGLGLVGSAMAIVAVARIGLSQLPVVFLLAVFMIVAALIVAAPWLHRWRHSLREARDEKLLADARADMAAHLHDSVLQTLALIQRQAGDPKAVAALARRQERELRTWLYGETANHATVKAALQEAAAEVEDERGTSIEVVCVGDAPMTTNLMALVNASREAMVNAAKHSGADVIDVYAEVSETEIEVFIRDRGMGFDLTEIADDRMGVRGSIIERMERHGGKASIRSAPGEGTEVRLEMKR